jgi:transcription elongation factor GreB
MRQLAELNGRIGLLNQRIATAKVVESHAQPANEVRFGATVTLRTVSSMVNTQQTIGSERRLTIVGVDEADASHGLIAFTAPIARAMQGKRIGDTVTLRMGRGEDVMEVVDILYKDA